MSRALRFLRRRWLESIAVVSLAGLIVAVDPVKLVELYGRLRLPIVALMLPAVLLVYCFRGLGWWVALRHLGVQISPIRAIYVMFAGQTLIFMPTGDLARVALVRRTGASGRDEGTLAGSITFQELIFLGLLGLGVLPRVFSQPDVAFLVLAMSLAHIAIFVILLVEPVYDWAVGMVERVRLLRRFDRQLRSLRPAFLTMMTPSNLIGVVAFNAGAAGMLFLLFWLSLQALGVGRVTFVQAAFVYGLAHLLSGLSFLPGGIGSMEALIVALLAAQGIPPTEGAAAGVLFRGFNDILMAGIGAAAGVLVERKARARSRARSDP